MKPLSIIFATFLFSAVLISAGGFYAGMVNDYQSIGASEKIDTGLSIEAEASLDTTLTSSENMESGLLQGIDDIPFIGGILVQVFSVWQMLKSFMTNLWDSLTIGASLINNLRDLLIPYTIPPQIMTIIQASVVMMFIASMIYLILGRKVD